MALWADLTHGMCSYAYLKISNKVRPGTRKQSLAQASETLQVNPTKYKQIEPHPIEPTLMKPNQIIPNQTESRQSELKRNESDQHKYTSKAMASNQCE